MMESNKSAKIFVAGHRGMVGSSILRTLNRKGYNNIVTRDRTQLDLTNQLAVREFFQKEKPDQVYLAAAKVGGISANNKYPAEFIYQSLMIESNVIHHAWEFGVKKLLFLGSSCIYPKEAVQPMSEDSLLSGKLEPTNEPYAIAKIAGIKLCESYNRQYNTDFRSVMPTNLYGPGDNYHPENSHVIPGLMRRLHEAKTNGDRKIVVWGSGNPKREFLYVDDMADACVHVMDLNKEIYDLQTKPMQGHVNVGCGMEVTIRELVEILSEVVGYSGEVEYDTRKPDGPMRKVVNSDKLNCLGWKSKTSLINGLKLSYEDFKLKVAALV